MADKKQQPGGGEQWFGQSKIILKWFIQWFSPCSLRRIEYLQSLVFFGYLYPYEQYYQRLLVVTIGFPSEQLDRGGGH